MYGQHRMPPSPQHDSYGIQQPPGEFVRAQRSRPNSAQANAQAQVQQDQFVPPPSGIDDDDEDVSESEEEESKTETADNNGRRHHNVHSSGHAEIGAVVHKDMNIYGITTRVSKVQSSIPAASSSGSSDGTGDKTIDGLYHCYKYCVQKVFTWSVLFIIIFNNCKPYIVISSQEAGGDCI